MQGVDDTAYSDIRHVIATMMDDGEKEVPPKKKRPSTHIKESPEDMMETAIDLNILGVVDPTGHSVEKGKLSSHEKNLLAAQYLQKAMQLHDLASKFEQKALSLLPSVQQDDVSEIRFKATSGCKKNITPVRVPKIAGKTRFTCELCGNMFGSWGGCDSHIRREHTFDKYGPCDACKRFSTFNWDSWRTHTKHCA